MEGDGDAGGGHVAVALEVDVAVAEVGLQLLGDGLDDPEVGLVGDDQADVGGLEAGALEGALGGGVHGVDGEFVDFLAGHLEGVEVALEDLGVDGEAAAAGGEGEDIGLGAVGAHVSRQDAVPLGPVADDDGAGAVSEEDAGVAVFPVDDGGEFFGADDEDGLVDVGGDELLGDDEGVEEAGAGGLEIEGGGAAGADLMLDVAGGGGEDGVGRAGGDDDEIDVLGGDAAFPHGLEGGLGAHVGGEFVGGGDAPLFDAGAGGDPLVGGVDEFFQLGVGQDPRGQVGAGAEDGGVTARMGLAGMFSQKLGQIGLGPGIGFGLGPEPVGRSARSAR